MPLSSCDVHVVLCTRTLLPFLTSFASCRLPGTQSAGETTSWLTCRQSRWSVRDFLSVKHLTSYSPTRAASAKGWANENIKHGNGGTNTKYLYMSHLGTSPAFDTFLVAVRPTCMLMVLHLTPVCLLVDHIQYQHAIRFTTRPFACISYISHGGSPSSTYVTLAVRLHTAVLVPLRHCYHCFSLCELYVARIHCMRVSSGHRLNIRVGSQLIDFCCMSTLLGPFALTPVRLS